MPVYQINTPQGKFKITSDRELTGEEQVQKARQFIRSPAFKKAPAVATAVAPQEKLPADIHKMRQEFEAQPWYKQLAAGLAMPVKEMWEGLQVTAYPGMTGEDYEREIKNKAARQMELQRQQMAQAESPLAQVGQVTADIGLTAAPAMAGARVGALARMAPRIGAGLGAGAGSAMVHQLQAMGRTGRPEITEGLTETFVSGLLPGLGQIIGEPLKKWAPGMLRSAVKPPRKIMEKVKPPNFIKPLEDKLITFFGGLEQGLENVQGVVRNLAQQRDVLIANSNIKVNITNANRKVAGKLNQMVKKGEIDASDAEKAFKQYKGKLRTAMKMRDVREPGKVIVTGSQAIDIRKLADKKSRFNPFTPLTADPSEVIYNEAYRRVLEEEIENVLMKKVGLTTKTKYKNLKKEMTDLIPFQKAAEFRLGQMGNNYQFNLMDLAALGVGSSVFGGKPVTRLVGAAGTGTLRRLTQTPGGARMMYEAGKRLEAPGAVIGGLGQLGRSMYGRRRSLTHPKPGTIIQGYRFKGGDASKEENWEIVE